METKGVTTGIIILIVSIVFMAIGISSVMRLFGVTF